ncbi:MAG TPA: hypothetical protein VG733_15285 [Chthoniobacteraceae bacterium]|nr:hypothetical protein [Chthoniobacteraceae bacterium]
MVDEDKANFEQVNKKLDVLLLNDAKGGEKFMDFEQRITRLENRADEGSSRSTKINAARFYFLATDGV